MSEGRVRRARTAEGSGSSADDGPCARHSYAGRIATEPGSCSVHTDGLRSTDRRSWLRFYGNRYISS